MVNAYIENSYKLVFPLFCEGYLNLDYDPTVVTLEADALAATGEIQHSTTLESSGVLVNGAINDNSTTNIVVDTVDATTKFEVGDNVYDANNALVGVVGVITATQITLAANNDEALANNENLKKNVTTTTTLRNRGIWAHDSNFVLEAIFTPYDVNGIGSRTAGRHGVLDSQKTPPYPSDAYGDRSGYESVDYLGASAYLTQKMMLFHNTNLKLYLQNTTSSSYNQPAEYKVVVELTKGETTKTIQSDTVIKAIDSLQGYYDASGYYSDITTNYQRITTNATGSNPTGTITIQDYEDLESNVKATGQIVVSGTPTHYASALSASATIDIGGSGSDYTVPADTSQSAGTGDIVVKAVPSAVAVADKNTDFISLDDNTTTYYLYPQSTGTNGGILAGQLGWNANSYLFRIGGNTTITATNLKDAINLVSGLSDGISASQPTVNDTVDLMTQQATAIWNGGITLGSGYGGSDFTFTDISGGNAGTEVNSYITITNTAGTAKNYKATDFTGTTTGSTGTTNSGSVNVVFYKNSSSLNATANNLRAAILHANGHNGTITSTTNNPLTLTQATTGTAGNNTISLTGLGSSDVVVTGFANGANIVNNSNTPFIQLINAAGSAVTKKYVPVANGDVIATSATQTIGSVSGAVAFQVGANATATAANLETAIEHANGHNGSISVSNSSGTLTLTQGTAGTAGNTAITQNNLANVGDTDFANGATPDNYISITDAAGTLKKYKAAITEVTGTTDGTYVFYRAVTDDNTTATNLDTAIDSSNGHNGTLITTRANAVVTVKINQAAMGSAAITENVTDLAITNFSAGNNTQISVGSGEATELGAGSKIYDSLTTLLGTVASVSGDTITLSSAPTSTVSSTIYTNQLREALYLEQVYKILTR